MWLTYFCLFLFSFLQLVQLPRKPNVIEVLDEYYKHYIAMRPDERCIPSFRNISFIFKSFGFITLEIAKKRNKVRYTFFSSLLLSPLFLSLLLSSPPLFSPLFLSCVLSSPPLSSFLVTSLVFYSSLLPSPPFLSLVFSSSLLPFCKIVSDDQLILMPSIFVDSVAMWRKQKMMSILGHHRFESMSCFTHITQEKKTESRHLITFFLYFDDIKLCTWIMKVVPPGFRMSPIFSVFSWQWPNWQHIALHVYKCSFHLQTTCKRVLQFD